MTIQALCLGHALDTDRPGSGVVHSVFAHAVNLEVDGELWTVLAADRADLPLGVRIGRADLRCLGLGPGDPVAIRAGFLGLGGSRVVLDCRAAPRWAPEARPALQPGLHRRLAEMAAVAGVRAWSGSPAVARAVMAAVADPPSDRDDAPLRAVVAGVVGRGPGLTPAGDDVLVGILAGLHGPWAGPGGPGVAERLRGVIGPLLSGTTDQSAHLLRQAGRGLLGRALDELVVALGCGTPDEVRGRTAVVVSSGATSGADTCSGLLEAAAAFLPLHERVAA